jgi:hypothetical protein
MQLKSKLEPPSKIISDITSLKFESLLGQIENVWKSSQKERRANSVIGRQALRDFGKINKKYN